MNTLLKILASILLLLLTVFYSNKLFEIAKIKFNVKENLQTSYNAIDCPISWSLATDEYFTNYTVKKGDTLISIAKEQMGSTDRVQDLIIQNQDKFPNLSLENNFIEVGWSLRVLKPQYGPYTQRLRRHGGKVSESNKERIAVDWGSGTGYFYPNHLTKFIGNKVFKAGDCVIVTYAGTGEFVSIEHQ